MGRLVATLGEATRRPAEPDRAVRVPCGDDHAHPRRHRGGAEEDVRDRDRLARLVALRQDRRRSARGASPPTPRGTRSSRRPPASRSRPMTSRSRSSRRAAAAAAPSSASRAASRRPTADRRPRRRPTASPGSSTQPGSGLDAVAASAPEELRKGPRGGGREHVEDRRARPRGRRCLRPRDRPEADAAGPGDRRGRRGAPSRCSRSSARPRTARRSPIGGGPSATPPIGSPGTPSTTPGRSRTGASRPRPADGAASRSAAGRSADPATATSARSVVSSTTSPSGSRIANVGKRCPRSAWRSSLLESRSPCGSCPASDVAPAPRP